MKYFTLLVFSFLLFQCGNNPQKEDQATDEPVETSAKPAPPPATVSPQTVATYPSITQEKMKHLFENCDYIDFLFYETDFSMSQDQIPAIRQTLSGISTTPAQIDAACKPVGRVFFQIQGKGAMEADLFFGGNCLYYIFLEEGEYTYANQLTQQGAGFYQKVFSQVSTKRPQ